MEFALQTSGGYQQVVALARWAEDHQVAAFALPDHYVASANRQEPGPPAPDCFAQLAGLARDTTTIPLLVLVSPITFRHPAVVAKMAATIQEMAAGRFSLGVGAGWLELEHQVFGLEFPEAKERFEMLEEALGYLRAAFGPDDVGYDGSRYRLEPYPIRPATAVPLVIGGTGRRHTPRLAGTYADEFNVYPAEPEVFRTKIRRFREAAVAAGRDPDAIRLSSAGAVLVARTNAEYQEKFATAAAEAGMSEEELEAHFAHRNTPRGSADQVQSALADMEAAGVTRFYVQTWSENAVDEIAEVLRLIGA